MQVLGVVVGRMDLVVGMEVGMAVALEAREEEVVVVGMVVVVDPWVLLHHLETGGVASDLMLTVEAEAAAGVSGVEETATSGLHPSLPVERCLTSKRQSLGSYAQKANYYQKRILSGLEIPSVTRINTQRLLRSSETRRFAEYGNCQPGPSFHWMAIHTYAYWKPSFLRPKVRHRSTRVEWNADFATLTIA
jgi:hypothetical protein